MRRMPSQIELYEEMCRLSSHMAVAARERDWDSLVELERDVGHLRTALLATPDDGDLVADLARKRTLIQRILDDDAEVRRHTEPWMERVRHFLGDAERMRYLQQAGDAGTAEATAN
jgi:flagellar protein FliT